MILTCPACATKYVVKDGAIPPGGRQVRCAACKHSWHQDPEMLAEEAAEQASQRAAEVDAPLADAPTEFLPPATAPEGGPLPEATSDELDVAAAPPEQVGESEPAAPPERDQWTPSMAESAGATAPEPMPFASEPAPAEDEFAPFYDEEPEERPRRRVPALAWLLILVAAAVLAFWFLAPTEWRERVGIAAAGDTPLEVMVTNSDRQKLASGNELFAVSGRVINPTDRAQRVPPLTAELLDATKKRVVYSWTIAPPAATLAPGASASFNSAEVDVPEGGSHLRVTLGGPAA